MKRWHDEKHIAFRNQKEYEKINCIGDKNQLGRFRKQDAHDCGYANCMRCHSEKILKVKSFKQKLADLDYNEQKSAL